MAKKLTKEAFQKKTLEQIEAQGGTMSAAAFSRALGIAKKNVSEMLADGRISPEHWTRKGHYYHIDVAGAIADIRKNTVRSSKILGTRPDNPGPVEQAEKQPGGEALASQARLKQAHLAIRLQAEQLKLQQAKGELVRRDEAYSALYEFGQVMRAKLQQIPAAIVDEVMSARNRKDAEAVIDRAIYDALSELSKGEELKLEKR